MLSTILLLLHYGYHYYYYYYYYYYDYCHYCYYYHYYYYYYYYYCCCHYIAWISSIPAIPCTLTHILPFPSPPLFLRPPLSASIVPSDVDLTNLAMCADSDSFEGGDDFEATFATLMDGGGLQELTEEESDFDRTWKEDDVIYRDPGRCAVEPSRV